ncbi:MAG: hypothetical protein KatS3mg097_081 [Candidatus Parcubacteria bacterium]|nr:MAG: hypothetical protein KatS3mg097_081 [Candidatus Parcubacteria bacterium]
MRKIIFNKFFIFLSVILLLALGYYFYFQRGLKSPEGYILDRVKRDKIQKIVSGSGYVTTSDSFLVKSLVSGKLVYLGAQEGDYVKNGQLIVSIDDTSVKRNIRNIEKNIEDIKKNIDIGNLDIQSSNISLQKILLEYEQLQRGDDIKKKYELVLKTLSDFYSQYANDFNSIDRIYFNKDLDSNFDNIDYYLFYFPQYKNLSDNLRRNKDSLKKEFDDLYSNFQTTKYQSNVFNKDLIDKTYAFVLKNQNFIKDILDIIIKLKNDIIFNQSLHAKQNIIEQHFTTLNSIYNKYTKYNDELAVMSQTLNNYNDSLRSKSLDIETMKNTIEQKKKNIEKLNNELKKAQQDLEDLKEDLKDYNIYAPLSGIIQKKYYNVNDLINSGSAIYNIISDQKIAELDLNEVDVVSVKVGQKAILTFDAEPNLQLEGKVLSIDYVGDVNQGVVSYKVKISLPDNNKLKLGMTVNAEIIVEIKDNILVVPNNAIQSLNNKKFILVPDEKDNISNISERPVKLNFEPKKIFIKTGISDNRFTEIIDGLKENDIFILKKIDNNNTTLTQSQGLFQRLMPNPRQFTGRTTTTNNSRNR